MRHGRSEILSMGLELPPMVKQKLERNEIMNTRMMFARVGAGGFLDRIYKIDRIKKGAVG